MSIRNRLEAHAAACREAIQRGEARPRLLGVLRHLRYTDLTGADLSVADLRGADLCDAELCRADLSRADLSRADLSGAYLGGADLSGADLTGADLTGSYLGHAHLSGINLTGARGTDGIPREPSPGLAVAVLRQITEHPESWRQEAWHSDCGTVHCCAGWAVVLAGDSGREAEARLGTGSAARLLLGGEGHPFGADDRKSVIPWLQARAAEEARQ